jgi:hypothetical protein
MEVYLNKQALTENTRSEACFLLVGEYISGGAFREVFRNRIDAESVIKIEEGSGNFCNIKEWEIWSQVQYGAISKFFAPCLHISPNGTVLIQAKTMPIAKRDLPKKVPAFMTDLHARNWGWYKGRAVCHDYGNILFEQGSNLKKAIWTGT